METNVLWKFLTDNLGHVLTILGIIVAFVIYRLQRNKKRLSYEELRRIPLLQDKQHLEGNIKILYNNNEVNDLSILEIKVANTGNVSILASDFVEPLRFVFDPNVVIMSTEVVNQEPKRLYVPFVLDANKIVVQPLLLNAKDCFTIKVVLANEKNIKYSIDGRIIGVKEINSDHLVVKRLLSLVFGVIIPTLLIVVVETYRGHLNIIYDTGTVDIITTFVLFTSGFLFSYFYPINDKFIKSFIRNLKQKILGSR